MTQGTRLVGACVLSWTLALGLLLSGETSATDGQPPGVYAGVGVMANQSPYVGDDYRLMALPFLGWRGERWSIWGPRLSYRVFDTGTVSGRADVSWRSRPIGGRFRGRDLDGISRRSTVEAGGRVQVRIPDTPLRLSLGTGTDVLDRHGGTEVEARASLVRRYGPLILLPEVSITWQSRSYARYDRGVTSAEANGPWSPYDPGDVMLPGVGVTGFLFLSERTSLFGRLQYEWLEGDIRASPIVDDSGRALAMIALLYRF